MSKEKLIQADKKELRKEVNYQVALSLNKLKELLGEKEFKSRLKKAVKILTEDMETGKKEKTDKTNKKPGKEKSAPKEPKKTDKVLKGLSEIKIPVKKATKIKTGDKAKK